jgi:hypothetical protein
MADDIRQVLAELSAWGSARDWIGPDPYEALNAPAGALVRRSRRAMQAIIQLNRRSPVQPPWPLRARSEANAKVAGLVLSAYALPGGADLDGAAEWVTRMQRRLEALRLDSSAWGYHFDVQTRHLFYGRTTPNAIATCFAVRGLLDAAEAGGSPDRTELALEARPFLASLLRESEHGRFFAYVPAGSELIHNANLMVCGTLARLLELEPDDELAALVDEAAETTVRLRRDDGNWPYGERADLSWRDNFHTAYTIEGLARLSARDGRTDLLADATERWLEAFFDASDAATFHPHRSRPADLHSAASAIDTMCVVAAVLPEQHDHLTERAYRVAERTIELLWLPDSRRFAMQVNSRGVNRREFMRYANAPMFEALARLLSSPRPR